MDIQKRARDALEQYLQQGDLEGLARVMAWANVPSLTRRTNSGTIIITLTGGQHEQGQVTQRTPRRGAEGQG
jgi:hypothetical protein